MTKTGFIAIVGNANAGKSTLLNSLIRQKVSIVSPKPQTTRENILGILTEDDFQMVFVDTPGELKVKNALGEFMRKNIDKAVVDVDCILLVIDGHDGISDYELSLVDTYAKKKIPLVIAVSKTDISQAEKLMPELEKLNAKEGISEVYCVSARRNKNIDLLREGLKKYLSEGEMFFDQDDVTDKSLQYLVCEHIREKILLVLDKEVPHGIGVTLNKMEYDEEKLFWSIDANVIVEKASHKPIILGKRGEMIKQISIHARAGVEKVLDARVYLELWVKVKPNWRNDQNVMTQIGYNKKKL